MATGELGSDHGSGLHGHDGLVNVVVATTLSWSVTSGSGLNCMGLLQLDHGSRTMLQPL